MEGTIGEVRIFAGNFAPRNWAFCQGQLIQISQNAAMFSILGTTYGGDGRTTFGLPDLRGRSPIGAGQGPGLSNRFLGSKSGSETTTLAESNLPSHDHNVSPPADSNEGNLADPSGNVPAATEDPVNAYSSTNNTTMASTNTSTTGGGNPANNMQPFMAMHYVICLAGVFPTT